jgi:heme exporter protein A
MLWALESAIVSTLVELQNVTKTYGPVRALVGVSCSFTEGTVSVVRGANGSGKSTLLGIVGTVIRPSSGRVDHGGLGGSRAAVRRNVGWVGHDTLCYPELTGRQNIEFAARLYGIEADGAVARAMTRFELGPFAERPVRTYSRGQRQRVALARALVHLPKLVLLDEPTTGLDALGAERVKRIVREEADGGAAVVVVTHDREFGVGMGAQVIELEHGRATSRMI